jgi:type VI secretion system protein VasI
VPLPSPPRSRLRLPSLLWVLGGIAVVVPSGAAQDLEVIRICAAMANPESRLHCYDRLVTTLGVSPAGPGGELWTVEFRVDPLTDVRSARAVLPALEGKGVDDVPVQFILECQEGRTTVLLDWAQTVGDGNTIVLRLDGDEPQNTFWDMARNRTTARYRSDGAPLARAIAPRRRMVARVTPSGREPVTTIFELTGMPEALLPVQEACSGEGPPR